MMQTPAPDPRLRTQPRSENTPGGMKSGQYPNITPPEPLAPDVGDITRRLAGWFWLPISLFALTLGIGFIHHENRILDNQNDIELAQRNAMLDAVAIDVLRASIDDSESLQRIADTLQRFEGRPEAEPQNSADWRGLGAALREFSNIDFPAASAIRDVEDLETIGTRMIRLSDHLVERLGEVGRFEPDFNRLMSDAVGQANLLRKTMAKLRALPDLSIGESLSAAQGIGHDFAVFGNTLETMLEGRPEVGVAPVGNQELRGILEDNANLYRTMNDLIGRVLGRHESERRHRILERAIIDRIDILRRSKPQAPPALVDLPIPADSAFIALAALSVIVLLAMAMSLTRQGGRIDRLVHRGDLVAKRNADTSRKTLDTLKARDQDILRIKGSLTQVRKKTEFLARGEDIAIDGVESSEVAPLIQAIQESIDHLSHRMHALRDASGEIVAKAESIRKNTDLAQDIGERHTRSLQETVEAFRSLYQNSAAIESTAVEVARGMVDALGSIARSGENFRPSAATVREIVKGDSFADDETIDPMALADEGMRSLRELESELMEVAETGHLLMLNLALRKGEEKGESAAFGIDSRSDRPSEALSALCERARDAAGMVADHRNTLFRAIEAAVAATGEAVEGDRSSPEYLHELLARADRILAGAKEQAQRHRDNVDGTERLVVSAKDIADDARENSALVADEVNSLAALAIDLDRNLSDLASKTESSAADIASSDADDSNDDSLGENPSHDTTGHG